MNLPRAQLFDNYLSVWIRPRGPQDAVESFVPRLHCGGLTYRRAHPTGSSSPVAMIIAPSGNCTGSSQLWPRRLQIAGGSDGLVRRGGQGSRLRPCSRFATSAQQQGCHSSASAELWRHPSCGACGEFEDHNDLVAATPHC
jgi:hypothetical protein